MLKKIGHWVHDYLYAARGTAYSFLVRTPPAHYLGHRIKGKVPIILIPGLYTKWSFLKFFADSLSHLGHPIYVLDHLGYNSHSIDHSAKLVRELIEEQDLRSVIILAHSKGGLIGKYVLAFYNSGHRVKKVIAIASPFAGSHAARFFPLASFRELHPHSPMIAALKTEEAANRHIVSIFGVFDNHVWPEESCRLSGARNIQVGVHGHHRILFDHGVRRMIMDEVAAVSSPQKL